MNLRELLTLVLCHFIIIYVIKLDCSLQIGYIKGSVGDSLVQLNRQDCLFKLSLDLQYLFVHCPSSAQSMQLSELEVLYADCFGYKLSCAVYGSPTVELLFDHQPVKNVVKVRPTYVQRYMLVGYT